MGISTPELLVLLVLLMGIAVTVLWLWMLVDCVGKEPAEGNSRIVWILVIILIPWIGALLYFFARRPKRVKMYGK